MSALVLLLPVSKIQAGANKIMLASMRSFFYQADVYGSTWILYISVLSLGRSVITSQCTPRFFSSSRWVILRGGEFSRFLRTPRARDSTRCCHLPPRWKKSGQNQAVGNIWLWYFCLLQRRFPFIALAVIPTSNTKVLKSFFTSRSSSLVESSHERVLSDKLHRFLWRKINEVSKEMDGKKHRVLPGIKTIWQQLLFSNKSYVVGFSLFSKV